MTANTKKTERGVTSAEISPASLPPPRLLRLPEVMERVGLRRSAIYQRMSEGRFPRCRTLGAKCSVWVESEINARIDDIVRSSNHAD